MGSLDDETHLPGTVVANSAGNLTGGGLALDLAKKLAQGAADALPEIANLPRATLEKQAREAVVPAAKVSLSLLESAVLHLVAGELFRAWDVAGGESVPNDTDTDLPIDTVVDQDSGLHSFATPTLTLSKGGLYLLAYTAGVTGTAFSGDVWLQSGGVVAGSRRPIHGATNEDGGASAVTVARLAAGATVSVRARLPTGSGSTKENTVSLTVLRLTL